MRVTTGPIGSMRDVRFVVAVSHWNGKLVLSRHRERLTWETQGGHIEPGETPDEAMRRELYEESGALRYALTPLCDYCVESDGDVPAALPGRSSGRAYTAELEAVGPLPPSEIAEIRLFDGLPDALTYPAITPILYREAMRRTAH